MSPEDKAQTEKVAMTGGAGNVVVRKRNVSSYERRGYKCRKPEAKKGKRAEAQAMPAQVAVATKG